MSIVRFVPRCANLGFASQKRQSNSVKIFRGVTKCQVSATRARCLGSIVQWDDASSQAPGD